MNTPRTKPLQRYGSRPSKKGNTVDGHYRSGLWNEKIVSAIGQIATYWPHVEEGMIEILRELLGGHKELPARQVFRSIINQQARIQVLTALLEQSWLNRHKDQFYDDIIGEFAGLNKKRNEYVHGLWWTHDSDRVFLCVEAIDDGSFLDGREVTYKEVEAVFLRMSALSAKLVAHRIEQMKARAKEQTSREATPPQRDEAKTPMPRRARNGQAQTRPR